MSRREERIAKLLETDVEQLEARVLKRERETTHKLSSYKLFQHSLPTISFLIFQGTIRS
jgi:hypothetical protein